MYKFRNEITKNRNCKFKNRIQLINLVHKFKRKMFRFCLLSGC